MFKKILINLTFGLYILSFATQGQPISLMPDITVTKVVNTPGNGGVRLALDRNTNRMYYNAVNGNIYEVTNYSSNSAGTSLIANSGNHGIVTQLVGMTIYNSIMYIAGSTDNGSVITGIIKKLDLNNTVSGWITVAKTAPYQGNNGHFDHRMNEIKVDPTGQFLFVNVGSETDHGDFYNGHRDYPVTTHILRLPITSSNLRLPNNDSIQTYVYCSGVRNSFGMAWDANGNLFATENSNDRDHPEELNWIRQGHHYGFPWRLGGLNNPQQFASYNPGTAVNEYSVSSDKFLQTNGSGNPWVDGWVQNTFHNDLTFPTFTGSAFTEPVRNFGPDADQYRDTSDFTIKDASNLGSSLFSFSPHLSPAGIIFDQGRYFNGNYNKDGYLVNYNTNGMVGIYNKDSAGGSLMHLKFNYNSLSDNYEIHTFKIVEGFNGPLGLETDKNNMYVIENNGNIWRITFPLAYQAPEDGCHRTICIDTIKIDGNGSEAIWNYANWASINQLWIDNVSGNQNTLPDSNDFSGRYKVVWKGSKLYILAEITDNVLDGKLAGDDPLYQYSNFDCLEVFLAPTNFKGNHERNNKAFALHVSTQGDAVDLRGDGVTSWSPSPARLFNKYTKIVTSKMQPNGNNHYTWELALTVYDSLFNELDSNNIAALMTLTGNQMMGFSLAYNDSDSLHSDPHNNSRRFMMGSSEIPGSTNNARNIAWQVSSVFGTVFLDSVPKPALTIQSLPNQSVSALTFKNNRDSSITLNASFGFTDNFSYSISPSSSTLVGVSISTLSGVSNIALHYTHSVTGIQVFTITGTDGIYSSSVLLTVDAILHTVPGALSGIANNKSISSISVFPNPTSYKITVSNTSFVDRIKLIDVMGNTRMDFVNVNSENQFELNLIDLPKGLYLMQALHNDSVIYTTKVLKE